MLQRLKVDDIVHPDDRAKAREFECPVCLSVPSISVAVQSVCCNVIFCSDCLAPLGACPNCRADFPTGAGGNTVALNPLVRRMLQNLKVFCPHHADAQTERPLATSLTNSSAPTNDSQATAGGGICTDKSQDGSSEHAESCCDWAGNYGDLLTKHIAECAYAEIDCPHGCGERFLRGQLSTHEEGCEKGYEECGICGVMVKIGGMAGHRAEAAEMHVKILEGERADLRAQVAEREAVQTKIDGVKADVRAVANELKTMNGDFVKLIGVNGLGPRVIWKVKTSEMFEQCTAKGDSFDSPEFSVGMLSKFVIRFLPVGSINSLDGKVGLYIMQTLKEMCFPGELEVVVSAVGNEFAAVSASYYWRTIFDDDGDYGTHSLMDCSDLRKTSEIVISLRHADGDNGRIIELGDSRHTETIVLENALDTMKAELQVLDDRHGRVQDDMAVVLEVVQALSADARERVVQAEAKERERLHAQKAVEARTMSLVSLGVTAVAVICLAIVAGRK